MKKSIPSLFILIFILLLSACSGMQGKWVKEGDRVMYTIELTSVSDVDMQALGFDPALKESDYAYCKATFKGWYTTSNDESNATKTVCVCAVKNDALFLVNDTNYEKIATFTKDGNIDLGFVNGLYTSGLFKRK